MQNGAQISSAMVLRRVLAWAKQQGTNRFSLPTTAWGLGGQPPCHPRAIAVGSANPPFERGINQKPFPASPTLSKWLTALSLVLLGTFAKCHVTHAGSCCPVSPLASPTRGLRCQEGLLCRPGFSPASWGSARWPQPFFLVPHFVTPQACMGGRTPQLRSPNGLHWKGGGLCCRFVLGGCEPHFLCS